MRQFPVSNSKIATAQIPRYNICVSYIVENVKKVCFLRDRVLLVLLVLCGIFLAVSLGLVIFKADSLTFPIILRFDSLRGIDMFGDVSDVWKIWTLGFLIVALNLFFAHMFFFRERALSYLFMGMSVLISLFLIIIMSLIINVN